MQATTHILPTDEDARDGLAVKARRHQLPIVVRMKFGDELFGMKVHADGVTFHSPSPIPVGKMVELILCSGTLVVDAEIVECNSIIDALGGFAINARYLQTSGDMRALITAELNRTITSDTSGHAD